MTFHRLSVLGILLLISFAAFVSTKSYPEPKSATPDLVPINKTRNVQILQANRAGNELALSIKNNYAQKITAFVLKVGRFRITEDFVIAEDPNEVGIQPRQAFARSYPLPSDHASEPVVIQAVVLEDKTGDGDPIIYEDVRDTRLGQAVQIKRALKVLDKYVYDTPDVEHMRTEILAALDSPEPDTIKAIKDIRAVGTVNRNAQQALSHSVNEGLAAGRSDVLRRIEEAKASRDKKEFLLNIKAYYETLLVKL